MTGNKVLFISQEITPYVPLTHMAKLGKDIPQHIQENGCEIRAFLPKWGIINERRNQLHEVIRLSGMNIIINDTDHPLLIKVASLQSAHMQVYFIDNDDFFRKRQMAFDKNNVEYNDNYERAIFYARSVIETTKLLRWYPRIIQCQGWISALAPFYIRTAYKDEPSFMESKIVFSLDNTTLNTPLPENFINLLAFRSISSKMIQDYKMSFKTYNDLIKFAINFCDAVICTDKDVDPELIEFAEKKGLPVLKNSEDDDFVQKTVSFYDNI